MIARSALLNLLGHAAPLLAALFLVPILVARLDAGRFGFLALAWVLIAYFSVFDLGFGRALSRLVAERMGSGRDAELSVLSRTAITLTFALGALAGAALWFLADFLCLRVLRLPAALQDEAPDALRILALCVPLVTLTSTLRGLLEAGHRFGLLNAIRVPLGVLIFAAPLAAAFWTTNLAVLAAALGAVRVAAVLAHWVACAHAFPALTAMGWPRMRAVREMFGFGAWLTVSNIVGPLLAYLDRFAVGTLVAVSAVAYYAAPYEVVTRLTVIPAALAGVLFPAMAAAHPDRQLSLFRTSTKAIMLAVYPLALAVMLFAPEWMRLWLGAEYALNGARVAQILSLGVMVNCVAYVPAALLQARGRADLAAKAHLAELPLYVAALLVLVPLWGVEGAALAWTLRCAVDALLLFVLARFKVLGAATRFTDAQFLIIALLALMLTGAVLPFSLGAKIVYLVAVLASFSALSWLVLLDPAERARARDPLSFIVQRPPSSC